MRFARLVCLALLALSITTNDLAAADPLDTPGDSVVVYTFDDLRVNCGWNVTTSGLYADLVFPSLAYMSPCNTPNGTIGLVPSREGVAGLLEVRVQLPALASAVSVEAFLYSVGETPTLIAYDVDGNEIGRTSDALLNAWVTLEVLAGESPISEIGLLMPQLRVYLDNIIVTRAAPDPGTLPEPEPDVQPEPQSEPTPPDPVLRGHCMNGGFEDFGFDNQGQCVSFLRTGRDSRTDGP